MSCETYDFIDIVNECNSEIVCDYSLDSLPDYPSINHTDFYLSRSIGKNQVQILTKFGEDAWEECINGDDRKQLSIFAYQTDSLRKYGSIDSLKKYMIYKRLEYTVADLERLDYKLNICY